MIIKELIEMYRDNTPVNDFKNEVKRLKRIGYTVHAETDNYVCFHQAITVDNTKLLSKQINP